LKTFAAKNILIISSLESTQLAIIINSIEKKLWIIWKILYILMSKDNEDKNSRRKKMIMKKKVIASEGVFGDIYEILNDI